MKLRDRLWCHLHAVCPKHLKEMTWGGSDCPDCHEEARTEYRERLRQVRERNSECTPSTT